MAATNPPPSSSPTYKTLHATATEFIHSQDLDSTAPTRINHARLRAIRSQSTFHHTWGHNHLVSTTPALSGVHDTDSFIRHLDTMLPHLESWDTKITDIIIDEVRMMAVVRASYYMVAKGASEPVENDLVWFLGMEEDGGRVESAMEFVDGVASLRLREVMRAGK